MHRTKAKVKERCNAPKSGASHQDQGQDQVQCTPTKVQRTHNLLFRILPDAYLVHPDGELIGLTSADKHTKITGCEGAVPYLG